MGLRCVVLVLGGLLCAVWASAAPVLNFATGPSGSSHHPHFSTDRAWYLTVGSGELLLWDARSERVVVRSPVDVGFLDGAVSPDLRWVMGSVDDDLVVYEAATGKLVRRFPKAGPAVAWVESTAAFRFADQSGLVQDYSPDRQQLTPLGRLSGPLRLISGDGSLGVTFDRRASLAKGKLGLRYWTLPTLKFTDTAETLSEAAMNRGDYWFTLSSSGRRLIAYENSGRGRLYTFDREKGTITSAELKGEVGFEASTFDASEQTIFHVGWYARSLLCSYDIGAQTDTPEKDLATNKQAESITISPDGSRFLISFFYGPIWVFEAGTRQAHRLWRDFSGFHLLGTTAGGGASFSLPGALVVVPNAGVPRWFPLPAHQGGVTVGNDTYIADTSGNLLKVGTQDGAPGYRQPSSGDTVIASPNGKFVATFNAQSPRVRVYRASTGELLGRVNPTSASWPQNLALDPEGAFLLVGATADGAASYVGKYSVTTGKLVQKFLGTTSWGVSMVVSPDGKSLFGSDSDGNVI
jgi:WD40 repeat protein